MDGDFFLDYPDDCRVYCGNRRGRMAVLARQALHPKPISLYRSLCGTRCSRILLLLVRVDIEGFSFHVNGPSLERDNPKF